MARELKASSSSKPAIREPEAVKSIGRRAASSTVIDVPAWSTRVQQPKGIARVPTHTVGRASERRAYARARLALPLVLQRVAGQRHSSHRSLHTRDISSSGVFFLSPQEIEPGTPIDLEVVLVSRPLGRGAVRMCAAAHVVRTEQSTKQGWYGLAATFDDITYRRDDSLPSRRRPS